MKEVEPLAQYFFFDASPLLLPSKESYIFLAESQISFALFSRANLAGKKRYGLAKLKGVLSTGN